MHRFRIETISDPCTRLPSFSSLATGTHATFDHPSALLDKLLWEDITGHGSPLFDSGAARPIGTRIAHVGTQLNTPLVSREDPSSPLSLSPGPEVPQEVVRRRERRLRHQLGHERRMRHLVEGEVSAEIVNQA